MYITYNVARKHFFFFLIWLSCPKVAHHISKNTASIDLKFRSRSTCHSRYYRCYWNCCFVFEIASINYE